MEKEWEQERTFKINVIWYYKWHSFNITWGDVVKVKSRHSVECGISSINGTPLQHSCLENPMDGEAWWAAVHGVTKSRTRLSDFPFTFHFPALEKEMATHSSVLAWRISGTGKPGGLQSMGSHRVGHDWSDLAVAAADHGMSLLKYIVEFDLLKFCLENLNLWPSEILIYSFHFSLSDQGNAGLIHWVAFCLNFL